MKTPKKQPKQRSLSLAGFSATDPTSEISEQQRAELRHKYAACYVRGSGFFYGREAAEHRDRRTVKQSTRRIQVK